MGFLLDEPFRLDALALGLLACLLFCWLLRLLWPRRSVVDEYPYQTVPLFTACEERFLDALEDAIEGRLAIFGKVRLADLIEVIPGQDRASWGRAFNRIKAKHIDFVLCHPETRKVLCAVELDDRSHSRPDRVARDAFVDQALAVAGLPIWRVEASGAYDRADLRRQLDAALRHTPRKA